MDYTTRCRRVLTLGAIGMMLICAHAFAAGPATSPGGEPIDPKITSLSTPPSVDGKLAASFTGKAVAHQVEVVAGIPVDCIYVKPQRPSRAS